MSIHSGLAEQFSLFIAPLIRFDRTSVSCIDAVIRVLNQRVTAAPPFHTIISLRSFAFTLVRRPLNRRPISHSIGGNDATPMENVDTLRPTMMTCPTEFRPNATATASHRRQTDRQREMNRAGRPLTHTRNGGRARVPTTCHV